MTTDFRIRTEDIALDEVLSLYVETSRDRGVVEALTAPNPVVLEGSRGTGKSFLLRVAEARMTERLQKDRVLPVYLSFAKSSLVYTDDPRQFQHWMLAKLCGRISRALYQCGAATKNLGRLSIVSDNGEICSESKFEQIARLYEESYRNPGSHVDTSDIPEIEDFKDVVEDICRELGLRRIAILFDEAAHVFRPEQQRQFFTLFRDLRSPYVSCNAAVYPGVTSYGATFQLAHDATVVEINRDILDSAYRENMREIILKQADSSLMRDIEQNSENFNALSYAVSGNPRLLLKTVALAPRMNSGQVTQVLKEFYRTQIWEEHSGLAERYPGHRALIDWGRNFIESTVLPDARAKNEQWMKENKNESTCYFWIHRDAPVAVKEALRLLSYTGVVIKGDSGIVATRGELGTRYAVNLGCLVATEAFPIRALTRIARHLTPKRFTEYGSNYSDFKTLADRVGTFVETDTVALLREQLEAPVTVLEITEYQKNGLKKLGIDMVGQALKATESDFQKIDWIGPVRSRRIMNAVTASVLEYLSG